MYRRTNIFLIVTIQVLSVAFSENVLNGASSCIKCHELDENKVNVHLVPHSHDDVGWLKTVDEYFYGLNNSIANSGVQYIITTMVEALKENPDRRFIQVETAFFWKWWNIQDDSMKNDFISLVNNGQIEMVNGAWSMNDEACVNYQSTIDQFTWGIRVLNDTLGNCGRPVVGWQIDPFGHSREHASILSQLGFDGVFFARLDWEDKNKRIQEKNLDFLWQGSANLDGSEIFGSTFATSIYYPPDGFCFDVECGDDSLDIDEDSYSYNVEQKVATFANITKEYAKYFKTKNVFIPMGGDFQYMSAEKNFLNMDRLIEALKNDTDLNVIYSTPSCYIQAVHSADPNLLLKTDDFFPYSSAYHSFWAGYFTSRPNFKRFERIGHNMLQITKQLVSIEKARHKRNNYEEVIRSLREVMGIAQHHDAITGTAKQHVNDDYIKQLYSAIKEAEAPTSTIVRDLLQAKNTNLKLNLESCLLTNISICDITQNSDKFVVVLYNPLSWVIDYHVRIPVDSTSFKITENNSAVEYDVLSPLSNFSYVDLSSTPSTYDLVFQASDIPPMGLKIYYVEKTDATFESKTSTQWTFGDNTTGFEIDETTNLLKSVTMNGITVKITQEFLYYESSVGTNKTDPSGAYIFRPKSNAKSFGKPTIVSRTVGNLVDEVQMSFNSWVTQVIRVYKNTIENYIEFDWLVGPLDNSTGLEIINRFTVNEFNNSYIFYTDSNGREMIQRTLNSRPDYTYNSSIEPIASNYYPVTSKITIKDASKNIEVAVLNDRSQGGSSLDNGQIELMVHRRLFKDDNKGVDECLNETEFKQGMLVRGQHFLIVGQLNGVNADGKSTAAQERILAQKKLLQPWVGFSKVDSIENLRSSLNITYTTLNKTLPENINILTFEPWRNDTYLLRLEHILEKDEDPNLSKSTTIDLSEIFAEFKITEMWETTLGANQWINEKNRYAWKDQETSNVQSGNAKLSGNLDNVYSIELSPMQIRTFVISFVNQASSGNLSLPFSFLVITLLSAIICFVNSS